MLAFTDETARSFQSPLMRQPAFWLNLSRTQLAAAEAADQISAALAERPSLAGRLGIELDAKQLGIELDSKRLSPGLVKCELSVERLRRFGVCPRCPRSRSRR